MVSADDILKRFPIDFANRDISMTLQRSAMADHIAKLENDAASVRLNIMNGNQTLLRIAKEIVDIAQ